jgi:NitT/TauT family transport system substrate-binding protein
VTIAATGVYSPLGQTFIAARNGYFKDEGLDVEFQVIKPSAAAAALSSGSVALVASACTDVVNLKSKGIDVLNVAGLERFVMLDVVVSNSVMASRHLRVDMPLADKFAALKGMKIAISGPGASTDVFLTWMLQKAGLDHTRDVTTITAATGGERQAALQSGQVDAFIAGPPDSLTPEADGYATVFISGVKGEIDELGRGFMYECLYTSRAFAEQHPEIVRGSVRAILRANAILATDTEKAVALMQQDFDKFDQVLLTKALDYGKEGFTPDGRIDESAMNALTAFFKLSGQEVADVDTREGGFWTNDYLPK